MFSPTWETQISSDMCSPTLETHIHSDICSPTWETQIPSDMCSLSWERHISSDMCSSILIVISICDISALNLIVELKLLAFCIISFSSLLCLDLCSIGNTHHQYTIFSKTAVQYSCVVSGSVKSLWWWPTRKAFFLSASPLVTSAFGQRFVGVQPRPKHPAACDKNPLVTRVWFNTILSTLYFVFYSGHGDVSKSNGHLCSHGCSMGLYL